MVKNCLHLKQQKLVKIVENQNHVSSLFSIILFKTLTTILKYDDTSHLEFKLAWSEPIQLCSGSICLKFSASYTTIPLMLHNHKDLNT